MKVKVSFVDGENPDQANNTKQAVMIDASMTAIELSNLMRTMTGCEKACSLYLFDKYLIRDTLLDSIQEAACSVEDFLLIYYHEKQSVHENKETPYPDWIRAVKPSADGSVIVSCYDNTVRRDQCLFTFRGPSKKRLINCLDVNHSTVFAGGSDSIVYLNDLETGVCKRWVKVTCPVQSICVHVGMVHAGLTDGSVSLFSDSEGQKPSVQTFKNHLDCVSAVLSTSTGLYTASHDRSVCLIDPSSGQSIKTINLPSSITTACASLSNAIYTGHADGTIRRLIIASPEEDAMMKSQFLSAKKGTWIGAMGVSESGKLAVGDHNGELVFYDERQLREPFYKQSVKGKILSLDWLRNTLYVGGEECVLREFIVN